MGLCLPFHPVLRVSMFVGPSALEASALRETQQPGCLLIFEGLLCMCRRSLSSPQNLQCNCLPQIFLVPILTLPVPLHHFPPSPETCPRSRSQALVISKGSHQASHKKLFFSSQPWPWNKLWAFIYKTTAGLRQAKQKAFPNWWHRHSSLGSLQPPEMKQAGSSICLHSMCPCLTGHLVHLTCIARLLFPSLFQCQFFRACGGCERDTGKCLPAAMRLTDL